MRIAPLVDGFFQMRRLDDELVAFPAAERIAVAIREQIFRLRALAQIDAANLRVRLEDDENDVLVLRSPSGNRPSRASIPACPCRGNGRRGSRRVDRRARGTRRPSPSLRRVAAAALRGAALRRRGTRRAIVPQTPVKSGLGAHGGPAMQRPSNVAPRANGGLDQDMEIPRLSREHRAPRAERQQPDKS